MSVSVPRHRNDPTGTSTLRKKYAQKLRGRFADLNTLIREGISERDSFGLDLDILQEDDLPPLTRFDRNERKQEVFLRWLDERIDEDILEVIERDNNPWIRSAYQRGLKDADRALREQGFEVPESDLETIFNMGVHQSTVQALYETNFADLQDITREMSDQIAEEIAQGFAEGVNPNEMARRITDRVDKVGKHRATLLARTRTIDAHANATIERYKQFDVGTVTVRAEWLTAGDDRVCPICINLEGNTWDLEAVTEATMTLTEDDVRPHVPEGRSVDHLVGDWPVKPPSHVQCRCRLIPEVT